MKAAEEFNAKKNLREIVPEEPYLLPIDLKNDWKEVSADSLQEAKTLEPGTTLDDNSRCVSVDTILIAPDGRNKKEMFKAKREFVKFRCSVYEKKLLNIKAKRSRLGVSEFCRRSVFNVEIKERFSDEQIEILKTLNKFHNNFKSIGNMFRKKDPQLTAAVYALADEIKQQLEKVQK